MARPKTHGMYGTPTYSAWMGMFRRCSRPGYQVKGITVCSRWRGPGGFSRFFADMGERPQNLTLDRINNDGGYSPENCRWATLYQQARNKGNNIYVVCDGIRMALDDACERKNLPPQKVKSFIWYATRNKGMNATEAFEQFGAPKRSWVEYKGTMMPLGRACKLAGIRWRPNVATKARRDGISLQDAFDHYLSKLLHPTRQFAPSQ